MTFMCSVDEYIFTECYALDMVLDAGVEEMQEACFLPVFPQEI